MDGQQVTATWLSLLLSQRRVTQKSHVPAAWVTEIIITVSTTTNLLFRKEEYVFKFL